MWVKRERKREGESTSNYEIRGYEWRRNAVRERKRERERERERQRKRKRERERMRERANFLYKDNC